MRYASFGFGPSDRYYDPPEPPDDEDDEQEQDLGARSRRGAADDSRAELRSLVNGLSVGPTSRPERDFPAMCEHGLYDWMCRKCRGASSGGETP